MKNLVYVGIAWLGLCNLASASVGGQTFAGAVADFAGTASLRLQFVAGNSGDDTGVCLIKLNGSGPYSSSYDAPPGATVTQAEITAISVDDPYYVRYTVVSIDPKQARGLVGRIASQLKVPAVMYGFGFSTTGAKGVLVATEIQ
ncbi:hypothetical protein GC163_12105 [bacterium]|nr:hypothetical protein [bacterium]